VRPELWREEGDDEASELVLLSQIRPHVRLIFTLPAIKVFNTAKFLGF
jgi:hypothetical protein